MSQNVHVLIPAGGSSTRLGTNKQLVLVDGVPLLRRAVERVLAATSFAITVVTGYQSAEAGQAVRGLGCRLVHNPEWELGLGSTLAKGVASLPIGATAVLVVLPDQIRVPAAYLARLLRQHELTPENLIASRYGETIGVPAVFPARLFPEFATLNGQPGARTLLQQYKSQTIAFDCPEAAIDLDTPADLAALTRAECRAQPGEAPLQ